MLFKIRLPYLAAIVLSILGCSNKEVTRLEIENDSLRRILIVDQDVTKNLGRIETLLDSIDRSRNKLVHHLDEGISLPQVSARLADINEYVQDLENGISLIQGQLSSSKHESSEHFMLMLALKDQVQLRLDDIQRLNERITAFRLENDSLKRKVTSGIEEANEGRHNLVAGQEQLSLLQAKIDQMSWQMRVSEAEAYYIRARQLEENARRTKLAPQKKRGAYEEALELYKMALSLGKEDAEVDIRKLENQLNKSHRSK